MAAQTIRVGLALPHRLAATRHAGPVHRIAQTRYRAGCGPTTLVRKPAREVCELGTAIRPRVRAARRRVRSRTIEVRAPVDTSPARVDRRRTRRVLVSHQLGETDTVGACVQTMYV